MASLVSKRIEIALATLCFLTGVSIYLLWRDEHLLIHRSLTVLGLHSYLEPLRTVANGFSLPEWVRFCLPDGLWSLSYILFIDALVKRSLVWTAVIPAIGAISELLQSIGVLPGTFDIIDLAFYCLPYIIYLAYYELRQRRKSTRGIFCI